MKTGPPEPGILTRIRRNPRKIRDTWGSQEKRWPASSLNLRWSGTLTEEDATPKPLETGMFAAHHEYPQTPKTAMNVGDPCPKRCARRSCPGSAAGDGKPSWTRQPAGRATDKSFGQGSSPEPRRGGIYRLPLGATNGLPWSNSRPGVCGHGSNNVGR